MKKSRLFVLFFALLLLVPVGVSAFTLKTNNSVYVAKDEIINGNLYAAGSTITIDGTIKGDVICAGQSVNITGKVEGDVICAGQNLNINGQINGSLRIAGNSLNINGSVARSAMLFGGFTNISNGAKIGWDALIATGNGDLRGRIGGDLHGAGGQILIGGEVAKNIYLHIDNNTEKNKKNIDDNGKTAGLTITKDANVGGNVIYTSQQIAKVEDGASIKGELKQNLPKQSTHKSRPAMAGGWFLICVFSALVVGLIIISLWKEPIKKLTDKMLANIWPSIGWGAVALFLTPIILILLLFTLIGIPLALILLSLWLIAIYISKILVGILVGRSIITKIGGKYKDSIILAMVVGIVAVWILCAIPIIGCLIALGSILWGLGGLWLYFRRS